MKPYKNLIDQRGDKTVVYDPPFEGQDLSDCRMDDHGVPCPALQSGPGLPQSDQTAIIIQQRGALLRPAIPGEYRILEGRRRLWIRQAMIGGKMTEFGLPSFPDSFHQILIGKADKKGKGIFFSVFFSHE